MEAVLARFGVTPSALEQITIGGVNEHWHVYTADGRYVLRRYYQRNAHVDVGYEHAVLAHAARTGWPVAVPLSSVDGETVVHSDGGRYSLFPYLHGTPGQYGNHDLLRVKGRLLARLHQDLASLPSRSQRAGFARINDLDLFVRADGWADLEDLLRWYEEADEAVSSAIRRQCIESREELARLGYRSLPDTVIHFEFVQNSLLFTDGTLTGLLDFDFTHRDARVVDIGRSIALDCRQRASGLNVESVQAFLEGYTQESPLNEMERRLIVPAVRAAMLWNTVLPLSIGARTGNSAMLKSAAYTATVELAALAVQRQQIEGAVPW
jgi:homoserine kinase type II